MRRARISAIVSAIIVASSMTVARLAPAADHPSPGVAVQVRGKVTEVLGKLQKSVADNGMMVMGELHQGKVLSMTGLKVESETIFVGNPAIGKQVFEQNPGAGIVLPVRINVYADADGKTVVAYDPPSHLLAEFKNAKIDEIGRMLDGKLQMLTQMLAK